MQGSDDRAASVFHESEMFPASAASTRFIELTRSETLSIGSYSIRSGNADPQLPHHEDEVYVVLSGKAMFVTETRSVPVEAGAAIVVPAGLQHHFDEVEQDLRLIVMFAPPESEPATTQLEP